MDIVYKLIIISVVFGLVLTEPAAKITSDSFDDLAYETLYNFAEVVDEDNVAEESHIVDVVVPKLGLIPAIISLIPKIIGLKASAIALAVVLIKWLLPKTFFIAIGAIGTFAFCKLTNKCNLAYDPVVYKLVPPQVQSFVTPDRLEDAQQFLMSALQQYANQNERNSGS